MKKVIKKIINVGFKFKNKSKFRNFFVFFVVMFLGEWSSSRGLYL